MVDILFWVLAIVAGGWLYRLGGSDGWNTKVRDFGVATIGVLCLARCSNNVPYSIGYVAMLFFTFGLMFLALTTYFKKKGTEARWFHWGLVGIANAYASILYTMYTHQWNSLTYRALILVPAIILVSVLSDNVEVEERGRGALIIASLMVYL